MKASTMFGSLKDLIRNHFFILIVLIFLGRIDLPAQDSLSHNPQKFKKAVAITGLAYAGSLFTLNQLWYADFERSSFHFFNDNKQWHGLDKWGHVYGSYLGGIIGIEAMKYSGFSQRKSVLYGGGLGFLFLGTVEVFDGFSKEWGFSIGDIIGNGIGTGMLIGQELLFQDQIVVLKYSYTASPYRKLRPEILGENFSQAVIKDYNAHVYWTSINLHAISRLIQPKWLNFAFGYGGNGMVYSKGNYVDSKGNIIQPYAQYYLSFDIDLNRVSTKKKWVKTAFKALNLIKVPSPTIEFNQGRKTEFFWLFF